MTENSSNDIISEAQADFALKLLREVMSNNGGGGGSFAWKLLHKVMPNNGGGGGSSTILSPTSVAIALAMVYAGAKDETAQEMGQLLANGAAESKVHEHFGALLQAIQSGGKNYTLEVANKLYIKSGFPILDIYKTAIDQHYRGLFESVNFKAKAATAQKINGFVAQATHDKIKNVISESMIDDLTRLILVNAIYFKGDWKAKFQSRLTEKKPFYVSEGNEKRVDMMRQTNRFIYSDTRTFQVLGMSYVGEDVHLFIVLPRERFGLGPVLANLTGKKLLELVRNRRKVEVIVEFPKFKLESTHCLNEPLKRLGIAGAFDMHKAQLNGITSLAADEMLWISQVVQKAFIDVNEEGTEAAAATVSMCAGRKTAAEPRSSPPRFIADHPFAFFLVSSAGQTVMLFNGIYSG